MKRYTDFLKEYKSVDIPLIQRDYVQGADVNHVKRDEFLNVLLDALSEPEQVCGLDFIYGTQDPEGNFLPLDGQQRLTTLFLLSWVIYYRAGRFELIPGLSLQYKTRRSSEKFCAKLRDHSWATTGSGKKALSDMLRDQSWFNDLWINDPSIQAMLQMLDKVDTLLKTRDVQMLADHLHEHCNISFNVLRLEDYGLTDQLYIKMNARGKRLTPFENWKAKFIRFLETGYEDRIYAHPYGIAREGKGYSYSEYFKFSIEHEWTDLFWEKVFAAQIETNEYPVIDHCFMNFFIYLSRMIFFTRCLSNVAVEGDSEDQADEQNKKTNELFRGDFKQLDEIYKDERNLEFLFQAIDVFYRINCNGGTKAYFERYFSTGRLANKITLWDVKHVDLFELCYQKDSTFTVDKQLFLYGVICYEIGHPSASEEHRFQFFRFLRNWLYSNKLSQRIIKDFKVSPNIRLKEFEDYARTIHVMTIDEDICSSIACAAGSEEPILTGCADELSGLLDDFRFVSSVDGLWVYENDPSFKGDLSPILPAFRLAVSPSCDMLERLEKFMDGSDLERIQCLVSYGYTGLFVKGCKCGKGRLFGKRENWIYIFRHVEKQPSLVKAFNGYLLGQPETVYTPDQLGYYMVHYPAFVEARLRWQGKDAAKHYFAVKNAFEVVAMNSYSKNPLKGYNTDPYACALVHELKGKSGIKLNSWEGQDSNRAILWLELPSDLFSDDNLSNGTISDGSLPDELLSVENLPNGTISYVKLLKEIVADGNLPDGTSGKSDGPIWIGMKCVRKGWELHGWTDKARDSRPILLDCDGSDRIQTGVKFIELLYAFEKRTVSIKDL